MDPGLERARLLRTKRAYNLAVVQAQRAWEQRIEALEMRLRARSRRPRRRPRA